MPIANATPVYHNYFVRHLQGKDLADFSENLELIEMPLGMKIYDPDTEIKHVYFPETSIVSIVTTTQNGSGVETAIVGKEGIAGVETVLSGGSVPREAVVQLAGFGYRVKTEIFRSYFVDNSVFAAQVLRYLCPFITQIAQNSACLCYHPIEKRLARWLLMFHERADRDELRLTQEFIALMLGVHRQNLNKSVGKLQKDNLIKYWRGRIQIIDRKGLLKASCECYEIIQNAFADYLQDLEKISQ